MQHRVRCPLGRTRLVYLACWLAAQALACFPTSKLEIVLYLPKVVAGSSRPFSSASARATAHAGSPQARAEAQQSVHRAAVLALDAAAGVSEGTGHVSAAAQDACRGRWLLDWAPEPVPLLHWVGSALLRPACRREGDPLALPGQPVGAAGPQCQRTHSRTCQPHPSHPCSAVAGSVPAERAPHLRCPGSLPGSKRPVHAQQDLRATLGCLRRGDRGALACRNAPLALLGQPAGAAGLQAGLRRLAAGSSARVGVQLRRAHEPGKLHGRLLGQHLHRPAS